MESQLAELRRLASRAENKRTETGIPRVGMVKGPIPQHELTAVFDPMINVILSGSKSLTIGNATLLYDPATYFVMTLDLPAVGALHPAPSGEPYLAVSLTIDPQVVGSMLAGAGAPAPEETSSGSFSVASVTPELLDAWVRMLRLIDRPSEIPILAPVFEREILYRVLQGPHGRSCATSRCPIRRCRGSALRSSGSVTTSRRCSGSSFLPRSPR